MKTIDGIRHDLRNQAFYGLTAKEYIKTNIPEISDFLDEIVKISLEEKLESIRVRKSLMDIEVDELLSVLDDDLDKENITQCALYLKASVEKLEELLDDE